MSCCDGCVAASFASLASSWPGDVFIAVVIVMAAITPVATLAAATGRVSHMCSASSNRCVKDMPNETPLMACHPMDGAAAFGTASTGDVVEKGGDSGIPGGGSKMSRGTARLLPCPCPALTLPACPQA